MRPGWLLGPDRVMSGLQSYQSVVMEHSGDLQTADMELVMIIRLSVLARIEHLNVRFLYGVAMVWLTRQTRLGDHAKVIM